MSNFEIKKEKDYSAQIKANISKLIKPILYISPFNNEELIMKELGLPESNTPASPFLIELLNKHLKELTVDTTNGLKGTKSGEAILKKYGEDTIKDAPIKLNYKVES